MNCYSQTCVYISTEHRLQGLIEAAYNKIAKEIEKVKFIIALDSQDKFGGEIVIRYSVIGETEGSSEVVS